ncbi:fungal-specific transcription factor domain-containing protein [Xylariaceae sp. FL0016]|nr:fungal-specific transcription factor domain-containing protein [Xylariaceae sp. FL0016]
MSNPTMASGSGVGATPNASKTGRVLACVHCQYRKVKCDRVFPCANCIKAKVTCTPSTPAPAHKRRRPNQDLLERLARCEALLKQHGDLPPGQVNPDMTERSANGSRQERMSSVATTAPTPASVDSDGGSKPSGKMVEEGGNVRFMDNILWTSFHDELQAMRDIIDPDESADSEILGSDDVSPENTADLFFPTDSSSVNTQELQPEPVHIFRLWQLFVDRVNPLTKVIHVPTLQPYVMEAATNVNNIPQNYQALLFSIYMMATVSLSEVESMQLLGIPRDQALHKFTKGCKATLARCNYLKNHDMTILQALVLFLLSMHGRYDRHALWIMSGTVVRMAQKMGYHCDPDSFNLSPFESEMRRRIWWQIIAQDAKHAISSGLSHNLVPNNWDTQIPSNLNDADLFPGATEPVPAREGPTEMAFCLLVYQFQKLTQVLHPAFESAFTELHKKPDSDSPPDPHALENCRRLQEQIEAKMYEVEQKYVDPGAGSVHQAALVVRPMLTSKLREITTPIQNQPEWGTEIRGPSDGLFKSFVLNHEHSHEAYERMAAAGFTWFVKMNFQLDVFNILVGRLCKTPVGPLADRGWKAIESIFRFHTELMDTSKKQYLSQALLTLKAWKIREQAYAAQGQHIEPPEFIFRLRECAPSTRNSASPATQPALTPPTQQGMDMSDMSPFMADNLDVTNLSWDMWGPMWVDPGVQPHVQPPIQTTVAMPYGGMGLGTMGPMGNMR